MVPGLSERELQAVELRQRDLLAEVARESGPNAIRMWATYVAAVRAKATVARFW